MMLFAFMIIVQFHVISCFLPTSFNTLHLSSIKMTIAESSTVTPTVPSIEDREIFKVFARMADKMILLDVPGAGTPEMRNCCHGGCDNCPYSHVFDQMTAGRAKWVPLYAHRKLIDDREHSSPWSVIFEDIGATSNESFHICLESF